MASYRLVILVGVMAVAVLAWLLSFPTPPGFREPFKLRLFYGGWTIAKLYAYWGLIAVFGTHDAIRINRAIQQNAAYLPVDTSGLQINDTTIEGTTVRIYTPIGGAWSGSAVLYAHGGGWIYGNLEGPQHFTMAALAQRLQETVISIDYRLAPEHPFPIPFDDCRRVVEHVLTHADEYGINPRRVALLGDSAGGTLMAAVSLSLRDRGFEPMPKLQVLIYPPLQALDFWTPSYQLNGDDPFIPRRFPVQSWLLYAFGDDSRMTEVVTNMHTSSEIKQSFYNDILNHDAIPHQMKHHDYRKPDMDKGNDSTWAEIEEVFLDPYFSPLLASNLTGTPQTYVLTMGCDVLRDDGLWYVQRLRAAETTVKHSHYDSGFHGLASFIIFEDHYILWEDIYRYFEDEL